MEDDHGRLLGLKDFGQGSLHRILDDPLTTATHQGSTGRYQHTPEGGATDAGKGGRRGGTTQLQRRGVLLQVLHGTKKGQGRGQANPGPQASQPERKTPAVQDGYGPINHPPSQGGGMANITGPQRCLLPRAHATGTPEVPKVRGGGPTLPVPSAAFRPEVGAQDLHQMPGAGGRPPTKAGSRGVPLPRRLDDKGPVGRGGHSIHSNLRANTGGPEPPSPLRKIKPGPLKMSHVPGDRPTQVRPARPRVEAMTRLASKLRSQRQSSARSIASMLGMMSSTIFIIEDCRLRMRPLQESLAAQWSQSTDSWSAKISLSQRARDSLLWWTEEANLLKGVPFLYPEHQHTVTTDASLAGWGAHMDHHQTQGLWDPQDQSRHINFLELKAVFLALRAFLPIIQGSPVRILTDNTACMFYIRKQGGTRSKRLSRLAQELWEWAIEHRIRLTAHHLAGVSNTKADHLSRLQVESHEWELQDTKLQELFRRWGTPDIDLFATRANSKCALFASRWLEQGSAGDAMTIPWNYRLLYAFPPTPLLHRVLVKLRTQNTQMILVAQTNVVHRNPTPGSRPRDPPGRIGSATEQGRRQGPAPRPATPPPDRMAPEVLEFGHLNLNSECMTVLGAARADSTLDTYRSKWKRFCTWCEKQGIHPVLCDAHEVLPYLLHLSRSGLQHASIRVHLSAIACHKKRPGIPSLFTVPVVKQFLRGLLRTFPPNQTTCP